MDLYQLSYSAHKAEYARNLTPMGWFSHTMEPLQRKAAEYHQSHYGHIDETPLSWEIDGNYAYASFNVNNGVADYVIEYVVRLIHLSIID